MKFLIALAFVSFASHAEVLVKDVGVLGLASHDMFTWDKTNEVNLENGRLDLSTIFDFDNGARWKKGGNPKNAENAPVYTVTMNLVKFYKMELKKGLSLEEARLNTVTHFHKEVRTSFERMTTFSFPQNFVNENVTNVEQAAMRGLHDILPGRIKLFGRIGRKELKVTNVWFAKTMLNEKEMNQPIAFYNGDYDEEYKKINIPFTKKDINLKEVDGAFIEKFSPYKQEEMLADLALLGKGAITAENVQFMLHLKELFAKGMCSRGTNFIPQNNCK